MAPAAMPAAPEIPLTVAGVEGFETTPPNWPSRLLPQQRTSPLATNAQVCEPPAATAVAPEIPVTSTGVRRSVTVPSPSFPLELSPQQKTFPAVDTAQVCDPVADTC